MAATTGEAGGSRVGGHSLIHHLLGGGSEHLMLTQQAGGNPIAQKVQLDEL